MSAGLLDTSVVIDWDDRAVSTALPDEAAISAVTLAELTAGPHLTAAVTNELAGRLACSKSRRPSTPSSSTPLLPAATARSSPLSWRSVVPTVAALRTCSLLPRRMRTGCRSTRGTLATSMASGN